MQHVRIRQVERRGGPSGILAERGPQKSPRPGRLTIPPDPADPETADNARERFPGKPGSSKAALESIVSRFVLQQHPIFA